MKKKYLLTLLLSTVGITLSGCNFIKLPKKLTGEIMEKEFAFENSISSLKFLHLDFSTNTDFICSLHESDEYKVSVNAPSDFFKYITVKNGKSMEISGKIMQVYTSETPIQVNVYTNDLHLIQIENRKQLESSGYCFANDLEITASGKSSIHLAEFVRTSLKIDASGKSNIIIDNIDCSEVQCKCTGDQVFEGNGKCENLKLNFSGDSNANLLNLIANDINIKSTGNSRLNVNFTNSLIVESSGNSKINYTGTGQIIKVDGAGASSVNRI